VIQFWHHIEHLLVLIQAQTHTFFSAAWSRPIATVSTRSAPGCRVDGAVVLAVVILLI
jgi:hypothetical protein